MKKLLIFFYIVLSFSTAHAYDLTLHDAPASVYFSPNGGAQQAIVNTIGQARQSVLVQAYGFTNAAIAKALVDAKGRGVRVEAVLDKSNVTGQYSGVTFLKNAGILVWIDSAHAIAHNKVMVIDGATVITGSFNFTKAAEEKNAENVLIIRDQGLARLYMENWERHREHSEGY